MSSADQSLHPVLKLREQCQEPGDRHVLPSYLDVRAASVRLCVIAQPLPRMTTASHPALYADLWNVLLIDHVYAQVAWRDVQIAETPCLFILSFVSVAGL